ncbi:response regulator [Dongia sp.]|uniref:response regulator n=1 Tax=Dongia sp. TaxID=1977262 RepID=UPI0035B2356F
MLIMAIDDDPAILRMIERMLAGTGHLCESFSDASLALESLDRRPVDLIITDIIMPKMEGIELILNLRVRQPALPIIAMSGGSSALRIDALRLADRLGASFLLPKPFTRDSLLDTIGKAIGENA